MWIIYLTTFLLTLFFSFLFVPVFGKLGRKFRIYARPGKRHIHQGLVTRWGGGGIYLALLFAGLILFLFPQVRSFLKAGTGILHKQLTGILVGATVILLIGMADDKKPLPAVAKFFGQIIAALIVIIYGVKIAGLCPPGFTRYIPFPDIVSILVTVGWIVAFTNATNLIDGLDGLAAGITSIAAIAFLTVAILQGQRESLLITNQLKLAGILSAGLAGGALGFLIYNFPPALIFLGDCGSMFLGFLLACIAVIGTLKTTAVFSIFIPVIVIGLPVLDTAFAIVRRMRRGEPITQPDSEHLHHRLLGLGWSEKEIVLLAYIITGFLGAISILLVVLKR